MISAFTAVTATAEDNLITFIAVILYWCLDPLVGLRFLVALLLSGYREWSQLAQTFLKDLFHTPRPTAAQIWIATPPDGSYAFPSGHTMNGTVLWAYLAGHYRRWLLIVPAVIPSVPSGQA